MKRKRQSNEVLKTKTPQYISIICDKDKIKVKDYTIPKDCEIVTKNYGYIKLANKEYDKISDE